MYLGGKLGRSPNVQAAFRDAGYNVQTTAANASHSNGPGECPHQPISKAICTMLAGAALPALFWPYAFHHFIRLYNITVHGNRDKSSFEICVGEQPDLTLLRTFGCRVYAIPGKRGNQAGRPTRLRQMFVLAFSWDMQRA